MSRRRTSARNFREYIRHRTGAGGEELIDILLEIAKGSAWTPTWTDENGVLRYGEPQIPSSTDRRMAAETLLDKLHGKSVPETEILKAQEASNEMQRIRAMSDDELIRELQLKGVDPGPEVDAELVYDEPKQLPETSLAPACALCGARGEHESRCDAKLRSPVEHLTRREDLF